MQLPRLARRTDHIAAFQVMELVKRAAALEAAGAPMIHMSIGEPDFTAPEPVLKALEQAARRGLSRYSPALGIASLREAIAQHYLDHYGAQVSPQRVIVTAGASAALSLACCALVDPGSEVLMTDPSYPCNRHFVAAFDGVPRLVPVRADTRFQMTREMVQAHWSERTRGVLLASPANPTGTSIEFEELAGIVNAVRERGGFAIVDEIYLGLSYGLNRDSPPAPSAVTLGEDVIVTNSFSKYFDMTGWRLGWLIVPQALVSDFEKLAQNLFICASTLAQHAALACFEPATLEVLAARREEFRRRRDWLIPQLERIGFQIPVKPDGAFYVWADCSAFGLDSSALAETLLENCHVSIVPGADFGSHDPGRWVRLSYATAFEQIEQAIQRMARFLRPA
jgi:aspartate/methionine/tyrosine aminotransferase